MRLGEGTGELAIHMPHIRIAIAVLYLQVLLGVNLDSIVPRRVRFKTKLPVILHRELELVTSCVIGFENLEWLMEGFHVFFGIDLNVILVQLQRYGGIEAAPAGLGDCSLVVSLCREVKIAVFCRYFDLVIAELAIIVFLIVPIIGVAF